MRTADFDYDLPAAAIAQHPLEPRDSARLLVDRGPDAPLEDRLVRDLPSMLEPGDLLVLNTTRVLPARLALTRSTGGACEVLLLERHDDGSLDDIGSSTWESLVRPSRKLRVGETVHLQGERDLTVTIGEDLGEGRRLVRLDTLGPLLSTLERHGAMPLPPYITAPLVDQERYQTVFAQRPASAAAPTAGLHLTDEVLARCAERGIERADVELVVGLGTFRPITVDRVEDHAMHAEQYRVPASTIEACERTHARGGRVVAVGTTAVRALESAAITGRLEGRTDLFIHGAHRFSHIDLLMTNFHQPKSSLLVLIDAFVGPRWRDIYAHALDDGYRFLSFGDAMLLRRRES